MSLAAMEDAVRDHMLALFDDIAALFKQFTRLRIAGLPRWPPTKRSRHEAATHMNYKIRLVELMEG